MTAAVPTEAMSPAGIVALRVVELTKDVVRLVPFQRTMELLMKLEPLTVSVKPGLPAVAELGVMLVRVGTGLGAGGGALMTKF